MKKLLSLLVLIILGLGGFYLYTQSGVVLEEAAPVVLTEEVVQDASTPALSEEQQKMTDIPVPRSGSFTTIDLVHKGSGSALIFPNTADGPTLRLQDFSVTRGPDLYVYLSKNKDITSSDQLGEFVSLGELKSSKGDQNYPLPTNYEEYQSVVIWCQAFGVLFSSATLEP